MELGAIEIAGLIAGMGLALKVIDKLVDAVLARRHRANGQGPVTNGVMGRVADGLESAAKAQWELAAKMERSFDVLCDLKQAHDAHEEKVERRFDGLHRRLDTTYPERRRE